MNDISKQLTPDNIKQFFEQAAKAYGDTWKSQASYYDSLMRRNAEVFTEIADARIASFREMREAKTFNQAFEANLAFEDAVRERLAAAQEANTQAWEDLVQELKAIYTPASKAKAPVEKAPKAKGAAKKATKTRATARKAKKTTSMPAQAA